MGHSVVGPSSLKTKAGNWQPAPALQHRWRRRRPQDREPASRHLSRPGPGEPISEFIDLDDVAGVRAQFLADRRHRANEDQFDVLELDQVLNRRLEIPVASGGPTLRTCRPSLQHSIVFSGQCWEPPLGANHGRMSGPTADRGRSCRVTRASCDGTHPAPIPQPALPQALQAKHSSSRDRQVHARVRRLALDIPVR